MPDGSTVAVPAPVVANHSPTAVSVAAIIPLYNGGPFIRQALESVLAQTEPADEIIVVDDGSIDDGPEIVSNLAERHPIRLLTKPNGGQGSARNMGIASSKATHIALLDQDDIWYEDHIAVLKRPFVEGRIRNLGLVYANLDRIDGKGRMIQRHYLDTVHSPHPKTSLRDCLSQSMYILPSASMFTREAFSNVGGFDERLRGYEDDDLFVRMFAAGYGFAYLQDQSVAQWRVHGGATSRNLLLAESRLIYFRKLIATFPNDPAAGLHWTTDVIAPRFFQQFVGDFMLGCRQRDVERLRQSWSALKEISKYRPRKTKRYMRLVRPLVTASLKRPNRLGFHILGRIARSLLKH